MSFAGDEKSVGANSKATQASKQSWVQPLGKVPTNRKEEAESIVLAVAIFGFFTTGEPHIASHIAWQFQLLLEPLPKRLVLRRLVLRP